MRQATLFGLGVLVCLMVSVPAMGQQKSTDVNAKDRDGRTALCDRQIYLCAHNLQQ